MAKLSVGDLKLDVADVTITEELVRSNSQCQLHKITVTAYRVVRLEDADVAAVKDNNGDALATAEICDATIYPNKTNFREFL